MKRNGWLWSVGLIGITLVAAQFVTVAGADTCSASTHSGCNGHQCPEDGASHDHYTAHPFWWDHWCKTTPGVGTIYGEFNGLEDPNDLTV